MVTSMNAYIVPGPGAFDRPFTMETSTDTAMPSSNLSAAPSASITPGPGAYDQPFPSPTPSSPPTEVVPTHTISLALSEDKYRGDAQFVVKLDGNAVSGPTPVTASHSQGATESFAFTGQWAAGVHDLEIDFVNDKYAGPGHDRNLYVDSVKYDMASYGQHETPLYSNGAVHFSVG